MTTTPDFYVTLPSNASTDEFKDNTPNHFKVRLPRPLHLQGGGWKVGLSSLSLPDTRANLHALVPKQQYLFLCKWRVERDHKTRVRRAHVRMDDIDHLDSVVDGEHFMRAIVDQLERQRRKGRRRDKFVNFEKKHWYVKWEWVQHGSERELRINNTNIVHAGSVNTAKVIIDVELALKMGWLQRTEDQHYTLGPNLQYEHIEDGIPNFDAKPEWNDLLNDRNTMTFWRVSQSNVLQLSMSVHWRFKHLNQAFRSVMGSPTRTLHIYSDVGGSSIVGGQVTDLLREVLYKRQGRGTVYFEPLHIQYIPLRNDVVDRIETQVAETNGRLVRFAGPLPTLLTLHFKQEL